MMEVAAVARYCYGCKLAWAGLVVTTVFDNRLTSNVDLRALVPGLRQKNATEESANTFYIVCGAY